MLPGSGGKTCGSGFSCSLGLVFFGDVILTTLCCTTVRGCAACGVTTVLEVSGTLATLANGCRLSPHVGNVVAVTLN